MKKLLIISGLLMSIVLTSCEKKSISLESLKNEYLPLEVGNYWNIGSSSIKKITGTQEFDGKSYYALTTKYDTSYVRNDNNRIIQYYKNKEYVKYDLTAHVNDTWMFRDYVVKLVSKTDTVAVGGIKFTDCYRFYFDVPGMADEEHSVWLAPKVGFIQEECHGECIGGKRKLTEVSISGQVFRF